MSAARYQTIGARPPPLFSSGTPSAGRPRRAGPRRQEDTVRSPGQGSAPAACLLAPRCATIRTKLEVYAYVMRGGGRLATCFSL